MKTDTDNFSIEDLNEKIEDAMLNNRTSETLTLLGQLAEIYTPQPDVATNVPKQKR